MAASNLLYLIPVILQNTFFLNKNQIILKSFNKKKQYSIIQIVISKFFEFWSLRDIIIWHLTTFSRSP